MQRIILAALLALSTGALGQTSPNELEIVLNLDVGYNTAYRDGTWVPVDVFVENKQRDLEGFVEVRVFDTANVLQSPTYRVPASCPQNSKKRFRLYAWVDNASRVEAVLYEGDRLAVDSPAYVEPRPIDDEDFLAVVLDEDPLNYQFFYEALRNFEENRRISREDLSSSTLSFLPEHLAAYEAIDFIVVGDVDLSRIPTALRTLLLDYLETGGTLVVFTGMHAQRVRDSWLGPHLGAEIQSITTQPEDLYRAALYGDPAPTESDETRVCTTATLVPSGDDVVTTGHGATLAVRRSVGQGEIITFAIDAGSLALQSDPRYLNLWSEILSGVVQRPERLNYDYLDMTFVNNLPQVSGVTIRPVSEVLIYLALYIGVGIVLNWVFWSRMKRREYAWLTLIFVSFAFTAYAVLSGTSGLDGRRAHHSIEVLRLRADSTLASQYSITGVLSARVTEINEPLSDTYALVREAGVASTAGRWGVPQMGVARPFHFLEGPDPAVQSLRIGANEVRGYSSTSFRRLEGFIEGFVDDSGALVDVHAVNRTGLPIESAVLYARGEFYPLEQGESVDEFRFAKTPEAHAARMQFFDNVSRGGYYPGSFYSTTWEDLLPYLMLSPLMDEVTGVPSPYVGPYFIGRVADAPRADGGTAESSNATTLILAELRYAAGRTDNYPLSQRIGTYSRYMFPRPWTMSDWHATLTEQLLDVYFSVPAPVTRVPESVLEVELTFPEVDRQDARLSPPNAPRDWEETHRVFAGTHQASTPEMPQRVKRYRIAEWRDYLDEVTGDIHLQINRVLDGGLQPNEALPMNMHVSARIVVDTAVSDQKEQSEWR